MSDLIWWTVLAAVIFLCLLLPANYLLGSLLVRDPSELWKRKQKRRPPSFYELDLAIGASDSIAAIAAFKSAHFYSTRLTYTPTGTLYKSQIREIFDSSEPAVMVGRQAWSGATNYFMSEAR